MGSVKLGSVVQDIRGSIGNQVFGRNSQGLFVRNRTTPTYTNTAAQQACRGAISALAQAWSGTLTDSQRTDWRAYAHMHPRPNTWGTKVLTSGYQRFIGTNAHYYREHTSIQWPSAPPIAPLWPPAWTFTAAPAADTITIALPIPNYPLPLVDTTFWLFGGEPTPAGVSWFNSPWKYIGFNTYADSWLHDPWTVNYPWPFASNNRLFTYLVAQDTATGAISTRGRAELLVP